MTRSEALDRPRDRRVGADDISFVGIALANAGLAATVEEIRYFAEDMVAVRGRIDRLYEAPFNDRYVDPYGPAVPTT